MSSPAAAPPGTSGEGEGVEGGAGGEGGVGGGGVEAELPSGEGSIGGGRAGHRTDERLSYPGGGDRRVSPDGWSPHGRPRAYPT